MSNYGNGKAPSEESFEFIETPPAQREPVPFQCGVPVTSVSAFFSI